jgi:hypothetical protein
MSRSAYVVVGTGGMLPVIGSSSSSSSPAFPYSGASVASGPSTEGSDVLRVMVVVPPRIVEVIRRVMVLVISALGARQ